MLPPKKRTVYLVDSDGNPIDGSNPLPVDATLEVGDIEIGAVEIKDGSSDNRQTVAADGRAATDANLQVGNADASASNPVPSVLPAKVTVSTEFTRPTDTTTYTAFDVVGPAVTANLTFSNVARVNGGTGYIVGFRLMTSNVAAVLGKRFRLHLFHTAPTAIADNSPYTMLYANRANRVGYLDTGGANTEGAGSDAYTARNITDRLPFVCAGGSDDLFGILEILDGFQPGNAQTFYVELAVERD